MLVLAAAVGIYAEHMQGSPVAKTWLLVGSTACVMVFVLYWCMRELVPAHSNAVNVLWYFFSLAAVLTVLIEWVASANHWIDAQGVATGRIGQFILGLPEEALNIKTSLFLALGIPSIVVAPQLLGYLLSGLWGCASPPKWFWATVRMFFYGMAKSFIVAGGVLVPLAWFGYGWGQISSLQYFVAIETVALMLVVFAFLFLMYAGYVEEIRYLVRKVVDRWTQNHPRLAGLHRWMTKYRQPEALSASDVCPLRASLSIADIKRLESGEIEVTWGAALELQGGEIATLAKTVTTRHAT
ncbi:hypothetical protein CJO94_05820 [Ralstonia solanacearum]|nr:hypothetical protein CJO94_05820 [Ralstonia solanacearum]